MVTRNDYPLRLFNGDMGIALRTLTEVWSLGFFSSPDGGLKISSPRLPEHETGFALQFT